MHEEHAVVTTVIAVVGLLLVAAVSAMGLKRAKLPFTVGLVLVGLLLGFVAERWEVLAPLGAIELSPEIILFVFLPTLIFESAFNLDSRLLSRNLAPVLVLAAPGLLLATGIVGGLIYLLTPLDLGPAILFGALISATDPVAVIALFKELGAPKRLTVLVEGESLFNDATAIVLFQIILTVLMGGALTAATFGEGVLNFLIVFAGGLLVGGAIGYLMIRSIAFAGEDPLVEVALSTVVAYAAFIAADHYLHVSGVMATVGAGLVVGTLGATRFTNEARDYLHRFWEYAAFVANSLIFLLVGISVSLSGIVENLVPILFAILAAVVGRAITVYGLVPVVNKVTDVEHIDLPHRTVLFWGGLRGAVALALALSLPEAFPARDLIIALAVGVVLFSLFTGGLTMGPLIRMFGLDQPTLVEQVAKAQAEVAAKRKALDHLVQVAGAGHFSPKLIQDLEEQYQMDLEDAERQLTVLRKACQEEEMKRVLWSQAFTVEQKTYRDLFDRGTVSAPVYRELELGVELNRDALKQSKLEVELPEAAPVEERLQSWLALFMSRLLPRNTFVQRHRLQSLASKYQHDAAVLEGSNRVVEEIDVLARLTGVDSGLAEECKEAYRGRGEGAMERIDSIAEHFPEYALAVQNQTIRRVVLEAEVGAVQQLAAAGGIPGNVAAEVKARVDSERRRLAHQPVDALEPRPEELLVRVPFFQDLAEEDFKPVAEKLCPRTVLSGEDIIRQGERGNSLFLIARGVVAVMVSKDGSPPKRVASLHAGAFFGEMALLTEERRSATVTAATDCQLYELYKPDVDALSETHPAVKEALVKAYEERRNAVRQSRTRMSREELGLGEDI